MTVGTTLQTKDVVNKHSLRFNWGMLLGLILVELAVVIWNMFDHSLPCWDTAAHRLNSLAAYELFRHPHFRSVDWYRGLCTLSPLYPPLFYWLSGGLKLLLGPAAETERLVNLFFVAILYISTYKLTYLFFSSRAKATLASLIVLLNPQIFWSTHCVLLDLATNAMVAAGLYAIAWWHDKPSTKRALYLGLVVGLAILTKHNTVGFFAGPILLIAIMAYRAKNWFCFRQIAIAAIMAGIVCLPWIIFDGPLVLEYIASIQNQTFGTQDRVKEFFENLSNYTHETFWMIVTPFFSIVFIFSLIRCIWKRQISYHQIYILSSICCAMLICSSFRWLHQPRYIAPLAIPVAIIMADFIIDQWHRKILLVRPILAALVLLAMSQAFIMAYSPNPIKFPTGINKIICSSPVLKRLGYNHSDTSAMGLSMYPLPEADWGMQWTLDEIEKSGSKYQTLMVMPNSDSVGASTLTYLIKTKGYHVNLKCCREYSVAGDLITFNKDTATEAASWYLLKSGHQGQKIADQQNQKAYDLWCSFIRQSPDFRLYAEKSLPDGSTLSLYRKTPRFIDTTIVKNELTGISEPKDVNFENFITLLGLKAFPQADSVILKTYWRSTALTGPCNLAVHMINGNDIIKQYDHDLLGEACPAGKIWCDSVKIDKDILKKSTKVGLAVVQQGKTLAADKEVGDWGNQRLLLHPVTMKLFKKNTAFDF